MAAQSADRASGSGARPEGGVTFVIPAKDRADLLAETLRSVREQTMQAAEVVVCDDGSAEDVESVARSAQATYLRNDAGDWGAGGARNAGLAAVKTPFVWFLDSDDLLLPDALARLHAALTEAGGGAPFAYGQALNGAREDGRWRPEGLLMAWPDELQDPFPAIFARNTVPSSFVLTRASAARAVGGFDPTARLSQDHLFWIRLAERGSPVYVPEPIGIYRLHAGNRHTPLSALPYNLRIADMGRSDPRLAAQRPKRNGVLLVETVGDAVNRRRPDIASKLVWRLLLTQPRRLTIARSAVWHFRRRRESYRRALELWAERADIRAWLGSFR
jgi:glycosyltransferase involved in cell wall biosynthesis